MPHRRRADDVRDALARHDGLLDRLLPPLPGLLLALPLELALSLLDGSKLAEFLVTLVPLLAAKLLRGVNEGLHRVVPPQLLRLAEALSEGLGQRQANAALQRDAALRDAGASELPPRPNPMAAWC